MFLMPRHQRGFSLIELLIGATLGLIVVTGAIGLFAIGLQGQGDNVKLARLNQDLRAMMDIMARDIRRAGFATTDMGNVTALKNNPFFSSTTDIAVYNTGGSAPYLNNCIVYAYNFDEDNPPNVDDNDNSDDTDDKNDLFGFRLFSQSVDGVNVDVLQMRSAGKTNASCADGTWENITEPEVELTALNFTLSTSTLNVTSMSEDNDRDGTVEAADTNGVPDGDNNSNGFCDSGEACNTCVRNGGSEDPACLYIRSVNISLTGRLRDDTSITQTITEDVRIRNDKFLDAIIP